MAATVVAGIGIGQVVGVFASGTSGAAGNVPLGTASAIAQTLKVNPQAGALSLGISFGTTLTNYQNKVAIAEARGVDLGIIGTLLAAEGCDGGDPTLPASSQPQPIHVEARNDKTSVSGSGSDLNGFNKTVKATDQPFAESIVTTMPLSVPGVLEIGPGRSASVTRYLSNGVREAIATSDISSITFGPLTMPIAKLTGLHWEVHRTTGATETVTQTFTVGDLIVGGVKIPLVDVVQVMKTLNGVLNRLGLELVPPESRTGAGAFFVDPLKIGIVPNSTRDQLAGTLLGAIQDPVRKPLVDFLLEQDCGNATYVTVADIVLGSLTGAGAFELEVGGVRASSGDFDQFAFPTLPAVPALTDIVTPEIPAIAPVPALVSGAVTNPPTLRPSKPLQRAAKVEDGSRGGALAVAAGIGLGLIALTVELDRRKMRHAQRTAEIGD